MLDDGEWAGMVTGSGDAAVVGSGPNGLAAAVTLARAGIPVTVFESADTIGGGTRTSEVVSPGVVHDVCSAIHPMALASPFFREFEMTRRMEFVVPEASYANPLDEESGVRGGRAAVAYRDLARTAEGLGRDGGAYTDVYAPLLDRLDGVLDVALGGSMLRMPSDVVAAAVLGARTVEQGSWLWNQRFREVAAPALISGVAAHSIGRMPNLATSAVGMVLGTLGHATGWPVPVGGSQMIARVLAEDLVAHGGRIVTGREVTDIRELGEFSVKMFDTSARDLVRIAGRVLPGRYVRALRAFRYGDAACKVDFVLDGPIPWRDERVSDTATVHVGGSRSEIAVAEREVALGRHPERPYVLVAQPDGWDVTRNPAGVEAVWSYTHVPAGSTRDVSAGVIAQIERFAPGFRDRVREFRVTTAAKLGVYNANYYGGDFSAGAVSVRQLVARPVLRVEPWRTPVRGVWVCSSSTPPGPGVHGLSGWYAACSVLRREYGLVPPGLGID